MAKILCKHFQYAGTDDFDLSLDEQINEFCEQNNIQAEDILSIKYDGHAVLGVNTYSALLIYKKE